MKYRKEDRKLRTVLVPNISAPVSTLLTALMDREGIRAVRLPVGGVEQIRVGKKYTHNDICFPCQMVIGELIDALQKGNYPEDSVAVGMAKLSCDCRMANYTAILRKALDSAGFENVPILTTDPGDTKGIHPGVSMLGARSVLLAAWAFSMLDILEELCRKIRPYETAAGETNRVFSECVEWIAAASKQGLGKMIGAFRRAIEAFRGLRYDRSRRKPRVLVTGELLVNFHPGTNFHVEEYLERNDMEVILPRQHEGDLPVPQGLPGGHQRDPGLRCPSGALSLRPGRRRGVHPAVFGAHCPVPSPVSPGGPASGPVQ